MNYDFNISFCRFAKRFPYEQAKAVPLMMVCSRGREVARYECNHLRSIIIFMVVVVVVVAVVVVVVVVTLAFLFTPCRTRLSVLQAISADISAAAVRIHISTFHIIHTYTRANEVFMKNKVKENK